MELILLIATAALVLVSAVIVLVILVVMEFACCQYDVLSWRLPSCRRCLWTTTTLHREPNMRRCPEIQQFWRQGFAAAGPILWNSLPSHLKEADLPYSQFRRSLKTFLFGWWGHGAVWTILIVPHRNDLTYLLYLLMMFVCRKSTMLHYCISLCLYVNVSSNHNCLCCHGN